MTSHENFKEDIEQRSFINPLSREDIDLMKQGIGHKNSILPCEA